VKLIIESTTKVVELVHPGGCNVPARIWEGHTDSGIPVHCYITRVAADGNERDLSQFEKELQEQREPSGQIGAIPFRMII
jgi:hypothetical protein